MKTKKEIKPLSAMGFVCFPTLDQIKKMKDVTEFPYNDYRNGDLGPHWVLANEYGAVCIDLGESGEIFKIMHEYNEGMKPASDYLAKSDADLVIDTLKRENDCAAKEIARLATMIVDLGYDPTISRSP